MYNLWIQATVWRRMREWAGAWWMGSMGKADVCNPFNNKENILKRKPVRILF